MFAGMEKMLQALIGMTPDEMREKVAEVEGVFTKLADAMTEMSNRQSEIHAQNVEILSLLRERLNDDGK